MVLHHALLCTPARHSCRALHAKTWVASAVPQYFRALNGCSVHSKLAAAAYGWASGSVVNVNQPSH